MSSSCSSFYSGISYFSRLDSMPLMDWTLGYPMESSWWFMTTIPSSKPTLYSFVAVLLLFLWWFLNTNNFCSGFWALPSSTSFSPKTCLACLKFQHNLLVLLGQKGCPRRGNNYVSYVKNIDTVLSKHSWGTVTSYGTRKSEGQTLLKCEVKICYWPPGNATINVYS